MSVYKSNQAAIIQGVSYPSPNLSHYEATAIWESGSPDNPLSNGWLGRYLDDPDPGGQHRHGRQPGRPPPADAPGGELQPSLGRQPRGLQALFPGQGQRDEPAGRHPDAQPGGVEPDGLHRLPGVQHARGQHDASGLDALSASNIIQRSERLHAPRSPTPATTLRTG